jgi:hypothetical protein
VASGTTPDATVERRDPVTLLAAALAGGAVAVALGVYGRHHKPAGQALFTLGFSGTINMKAWLATMALALATVQVLLAPWMYGKLGRRAAPTWVGPTHRLFGTLAFLVSLPVVYHCLWCSASRRTPDRPAASSTPSSAACSARSTRSSACVGADAGRALRGPAVSLRLPRRAGG